MATTVLSNDTHRALAVDTAARREYGDLVNRTLALSYEFNDLHKEFPILLMRTDEAPGFVGHAILGFDRDENLFVESDRWTSSHVPAMLARGPFSLGLFRAGEGADAPVDLKIMVDESSPRLRADGQPVFLPLGGETPYLERMKRVLQAIDAGRRIDQILYPELVALDLIEEIKVEIAVYDELRYDFSGYYSINQEKFAALSGEQLHRLHRQGLLGPVHFLISSLGNFQKLINLKIARLQAA
ncbi:MAG: hypothetical protein RLZZ200_1726 [Pseudomonadota bacterium]|jgi:hypothetical protein